MNELWRFSNHINRRSSPWAKVCPRFHRFILVNYAPMHKCNEKRRTHERRPSLLCVDDRSLLKYPWRISINVTFSNVGRPIFRNRKIGPPHIHDAYASIVRYRFGEVIGKPPVCLSFSMYETSKEAGEKELACENGVITCIVHCLLFLFLFGGDSFRFPCFTV